MATAKSFSVDQKYFFKTNAPTILGAEYTGMLVKAVDMTSSVAIRLGSDVITTFESLKGHIDGLPTSITECTFVLFEKADGSEVIFAKEYIDPFSIVQLTTQTVTAVFNDISDVQLANVKKAVAALDLTPTYTVTNS